tara:strand:+ start:268 stop:525 length:258 start_codon:yes stop_codon:yes gene_type:complete
MAKTKKMRLYRHKLIPKWMLERLDYECCSGGHVLDDLIWPYFTFKWREIGPVNQRMRFTTPVDDITDLLVVEIKADIKKWKASEK